MPRHRSTATSPVPRDHALSIRIDLAGGMRIGPGKIALLEAIAREGSISAAGRALRMSYRRAWELVEELNRGLGSPVVTTAAGGTGGGGATLTAVGRAVVDHYRAIETEAAAAAKQHVAAIGEFASEPAEPASVVPPDHSG
jgi:molybdate transport system regulatory protein